jgi:hypothetical protein
MSDPAISLTRQQLADVLYSAVVQGRDSIWDKHSKMPVGLALNQIAEGIADSVFAKHAASSPQNGRGE